MSKNNQTRFRTKLRKAHWYGPVTRALKEFGADFEFLPPQGKGHPKLRMRIGDREDTMPVPSTAKGHANPSYLVNQVRKWCEANQ